MAIHPKSSGERILANITLDIKVTPIATNRWMVLHITPYVVFCVKLLIKHNQYAPQTSPPIIQPNPSNEMRSLNNFFATQEFYT